MIYDIRILILHLYFETNKLFLQLVELGNIFLVSVCYGLTSMYVCYVAQRKLLQKGKRRQKALALEDEDVTHSTNSQSRSKCTPTRFMCLLSHLGGAI